MKTKVLIVDDSVIIRSLLNHIISEQPDLEVVGQAPDPYVARELIVKLKPDVLTLDIEMPRMDGITFLGKLMQHYPVRTVIFSSISQKGSEVALKALELGAIAVLEKPSVNQSEGVRGIQGSILSAIREAARSRLLPTLASGPTLSPQQSGLSGVQSGSANSNARRVSWDEALNQSRILTIGSSTGGTEALKAVLSRLPPSIPPTLIVQHLPAVFTAQFAENLSRICAFPVREATQGEKLQPGVALIAPGGYHLRIKKAGASLFCELDQTETLHGVRPAVDHMFSTLAKVAGNKVIGVLLTGMGKDGAAGMLELKKAGAFNICQDEATSVVWGMPKAAIDLGAQSVISPLGAIPEQIARALSSNRRQAA